MATEQQYSRGEAVTQIVEDPAEQAYRWAMSDVAVVRQRIANRREALLDNYGDTGEYDDVQEAASILAHAERALAKVYADLQNEETSAWLDSDL